MERIIMKILYVDDELAKGIDRLRLLFSHYLDDKAVAALKRLEADEYGATPQEIKEIMSATNVIDIEDCFPEALLRIVQSSEQYDCFIVDRNLVENPYELQEVSKIDQSYDPQVHEKYRTREGDYLLNWLIINAKNPRDILGKFNFLTAYNEKDMRGKDIIEMYLDFGAFTKEQFFDKSDSAARARLKNRIDNIKTVNIRYENRVYLDILGKNLSEEDAEMFLRVLLEKDEEIRIRKNLSEIRIIYEHILEKVVSALPQGKEGKDRSMKTLIFELERKGQINSMLRNYLITIWEVCSHYGAHKDKNHWIDRIFQPTLNSVNALVFSLKEVLLWFGDQCKP